MFACGSAAAEFTPPIAGPRSARGEDPERGEQHAGPGALVDAGVLDGPS